MTFEVNGPEVKGVFNGLKATSERQDDGAGILHQVAQFPIDQVYLYTRHPCPSPSTQDPEKQGNGCRAGGPISPSKPPGKGSLNLVRTLIKSLKKSIEFVIS